MKYSDQVVATLKSLHPGVRKDIRRALDDVNAGKKRDVHGLTGELAGFWHLRVGKHRVVFRRDQAGEVIAEFLAPRSTVYQRFQPPPTSE